MDEAKSSSLARELRLLAFLFLLSTFHLFILGFTGYNLGPRGDGVGYFAYLRSMVVDRDLELGDEYAFYAARGERVAQLMANRPRTETGKAPNIWPIGAAILWLPFFLLGHVLAVLLSLAGTGVTVDGYSAPYTTLVAVGNASYGFLALALSYAMCRRYYTRPVALLATMTIWFATSLTEYMYAHTMLSHPASTFTVALFLFLWLRVREDGGLPGDWLVLGLVAGLMAAARWQNVVFLLAPAYEALSALRGRGGPAWVRSFRGVTLRVGAFVPAFFIGFLPQMVAWKAIYGHWVIDPWAVPPLLVPDRWSWTSPKVLSVLVSSKHGLLTWTPVIFLSLLGLAWLARRDRRLAAGFSIAFAVQLYIVASWHSWHAGSSFGNRFFIEFTPVFVLGLAGLLDVLRQRVRLGAMAVFLGLAVVWNFLLMVQFNLGLIPREDFVQWSLLVKNQVSVVPLLLLGKAWVLLSVPAVTVALLVLLGVGAAVGIHGGWHHRLAMVRQAWEALQLEWGQSRQKA